MSTHYEFEFVTTPTAAVTPAALNKSVYWYDSGVEINGEPVYYEPSGEYAYWYWNESAPFAWYITPVADVGAYGAEYFKQSGLAMTASGTWAGTLAITTNTISDAWYRAETTAFSSLAAFLGCVENDTCFRGFLPVMGDGTALKYVDAWQLTSGGSGTFDTDRLSGAPGNWCSLRTDVRIDSLWKTREKAMKFTGAVLAWLKNTGNLGQVGNVTWCQLSQIPPEPVEYITDGQNRQRYWRQTINLELIYKTETSY